MNTVQIICLIGVILMSFIIGRASKKIRVPIMGEMVFSDNDEPKLKLTGFEEMKKHKYIVIRIISRQNQQL